MENIKEFIMHFGQDRKFVTTLISIILMMIGSMFNISEEILLSMGAIILAFIFGQGFADIGKEKELLKRFIDGTQLVTKNTRFYYSKKYWMMILGLISMGISHYIEISQTIILEMGGMAIGYILSQGMADKGKSKEQLPGKLVA